MLNFLFCLILEKIGITTTSTGRYKLKSAISAFTEARNNLRCAIKCESEVLYKTREQLEKQTRILNEKISSHEKIQLDSGLYLQKIDDFLNTDDDKPGDRTLEDPGHDTD